MYKRIVLFGLALGVFAVQRGLDVSGVENLTLAYALWASGGLIIVVVIGHYVISSGGIMSIFEKENREPTQKVEDSTVIGDVAGCDVIKSASGHAAKTTGDHSPITFHTIVQERAAASPIPWKNRPGGPQFKLYPGVDDRGRLLCQFRVSGTMPGGVEARWIGPGIDMDWTEPMIENQLGAYQMKPRAMTPTPPADEVIFEVRFYLEDGQHGGRWVWPIYQESKRGLWRIDAAKGSGLNQPRLEDTC